MVPHAAHDAGLPAAEKAFEAVKSVPMSREQRVKLAGLRADIFLLERKDSEGLEELESLPDDELASIPTALAY